MHSVNVNSDTRLLVVNLHQYCQILGLVCRAGELLLEDKIGNNEFYFDNMCCLNVKILMDKYLFLVTKDKIHIGDISYAGKEIQNLTLQHVVCIVVM